MSTGTRRSDDARSIAGGGLDPTAHGLRGATGATSAAGNTRLEHRRDAGVCPGEIQVAKEHCF